MLNTVFMSTINYKTRYRFSLIVIARGYSRRAGFEAIKKDYVIGIL